MNKIKLDKYEKEMVRAFEAGEFKPVKNMKKEIERYRKIADYTLDKVKKEKHLNLRVTESDLVSIKTKAVKNGIPYQTMISTLLHQFAIGKITIIL